MSSHIPTPAGAGGGTLSVQAPSDLTGVNVGGANVANLVDGQLVHTEEPDAYWRYNSAQDAAPSPGTVINNVGGGQFLRDLTYHGLLDVQESGWYVDGTSGDDNANGKTAGTAIKTWAELQRRIGNPDVVAPPSSPFVVTVHVLSAPPDVLQGDFFGQLSTEIHIVNEAALPPPPGVGLSSLVIATPSANNRCIIGAPGLVPNSIIYDLALDCWMAGAAVELSGPNDIIFGQPYYRSTAGTPFALVPLTSLNIADTVATATLMAINVGDLDGHGKLTLEGFDLVGSATFTTVRFVACKTKSNQSAVLCKLLACLIEGTTLTDTVDAGGSRLGYSTLVRGKFDYSGLMTFVSLVWWGTSDLDGGSGGGQNRGAQNVAAGLGESDDITIPTGSNLRMTGNYAIFGSSQAGTMRNVSTFVIRERASIVCQLATSCTIPDANSVSFYLSASVAPAPILPANRVYDPADLAVAVPPASLSTRDRFGDNTVAASELNKFPGRWLSATTQAFVRVEVPNP